VRAFNIVTDIRDYGPGIHDFHVCIDRKFGLATGLSGGRSQDTKLTLKIRRPR